MDWMRSYELRNAVVGAAGLVLTVTLAGPGRRVVDVGPVSFDLFYVPLVLFGALFVSAVFYLTRSADEP
ncbi:MULTISPECIES: hypothetical protein [Halorussus]|uniref:hypothetical protein n=1 Tax=Halorussus TaxID=1070314 RepID=UPI00209E1220|nr:hypothetical protein [Halorussus vallis]USZ78130.1 hypothetical protein NGM07_20950 [Halorussus vallis]